MQKFHPTVLITLLLLVVATTAAAFGQGQFRIGERVTYSVSFNKINDVAYAEIFTVSRGALGGKDAVELRAKVKTLNLVSAAFFEVDESRTTFVDPANGLPIFITRVENPDGLARETTIDHRNSVAANFDLLSLIYRIRHLAGSGAVTLQEGEKVYNVSFQPAGSEKVRTPMGEFDTTIVAVQSDFLTEQGFTDLKINLTADEARVPVMFRMKRGKKSEFRAEAASIQSIVAEPEVTPTPTPVNTPRPTPTPSRTPEPYVANRPLLPELAFALGETLEYRVITNGRPVGTVVMRARERREINDLDTLVITATVTNAAAGNPVFALNDTVTAHVNPETLASIRFDMRFGGGLSSFNQSASFDQRTGRITFRGNERTEAPVGTHSILSLLYAMRSFNLKPSRTRDNPVNDTRVAVFWESQPYIFSLRPSPPDTITLDGQTRQAQLITVNTRSQQLDPLQIKVWLAMDATRVPLRISAGPYQADLVSTSLVSPQ